MAQDSATGDDLVRDARLAEQTLIDAETRAERDLALAEKRYHRALDKLTRAQQKVESRRKAFEQARSRLDQCQLERAAGPVVRRVSVARPALPRPARDDSRARAAAKSKQNEPPATAGGSSKDSKDSKTD